METVLEFFEGEVFALSNDFVFKISGEKLIYMVDLHSKSNKK